jgi:hypothetical protein
MCRVSPSDEISVILVVDPQWFDCTHTLPKKPRGVSEDMRQREAEHLHNVVQYSTQRSSRGVDGRGGGALSWACPSLSWAPVPSLQDKCAVVACPPYKVRMAKYLPVSAVDPGEVPYQGQAEGSESRTCCGVYRYPVTSPKLE